MDAGADARVEAVNAAAVEFWDSEAAGGVKSVSTDQHGQGKGLTRTTLCLLSLNRSRNSADHGTQLSAVP